MALNDDVQVFTLATSNEVEVITISAGTQGPPGVKGDPGGPGPAGPANTLTVGTTTTGAAGSSAAVTIAGSSPNQTINFTIPRGDAGTNGPTNVITIGTVTTLAPGASATATLTGTSPSQVLNLGIPQGTQGAAGSGAADATTTAKGSIQLAGDLAGTAAAPTVPGLASKAALSHTHTASQISDSTTVGRAVLVAVDAPAARTAIGAGTSSLTIGTTSTTAKAGDYQPTSANISDATTIGRSVLTSVDATAVRTAIGAGTSSLTIGTTSTTAKAGDYVPPSDAAVGTASMRTIGTGALQAAAGNHTHTEFTTATNASTASTLVKRDSAGTANFARVALDNDPATSTEAARKGYVDTQTAALTSISATPPYIGKTAIVGGVGYIAVGTTSASDWKQMGSGSSSSVTVDTLPAGTTVTVLKTGSTWPARPTSRTDIIVAWKGADPSPAIITTAGTGGMLDNVDYRMVTP